MYSLPEPVRHAIESGRAPSPPQVLLRLLQMVDDDSTTMAKLAGLVEQDPGLCTRVLTAANSPAIRRGTQLRSIENCLIALGTRLVRSIATCLSVQNLFDERAGTRSVDLSAFWTHSLLVAELSRSLAAASGYQRPDEAYLAGLLHDVGELILLSALGDPYLQLLATCPSEAELSARESAQFGVHHGEIGTWLADQWHLDSPFADGILFHHLPAEQIVTAAGLPQLVWLAHALVSCDEIPHGLAALAEQMLGNGSSARLTGLRDQAEQRMCIIADAIGIAPPERAAAGGSSNGMPRVLGARRCCEHDAHEQIAAIIGERALMAPLQEDLCSLDSDAEVLLSLRESARILFDLNHLAFLLCEPQGGQLTGKGVAAQPAIFGQVNILAEAHRSLAAAAAISGLICSTYDRGAPPANSLIDIQFARALSSAGLVCIPMIGRGRTIGVIVAGLSAGQHTRLTRRLPCVANFGRIAGVTLESWRNAQDLRQEADEAVSARFTRHARRVVHEAGNPLTIIKGYLRILDGKLPAGAGVHHELKVLSEEIDRVASIVRRMSEVPAGGSTDKAVDVCELVRELLQLYRETLFDARGIGIETSLPLRPVRIAADRGSIKQILVNLWKNASEALSPGQRVKLSLSEDILHQGQPVCELRIEDNGPGMSAMAMSALHRAAEGRLGATRGIGLSIVGALAHRLGIPVSCRSKAGQGTMISLLLPTPGRVECRSDGEAKPN
ncbi:MAG: HDOD domain-containing protein [Candidatus Accumulibacter sp.]|jgi:HD-like signal output (HDOD) protein/signal transduction histidine kinase|uniref:HDOD domain-containing protein n=1 Tax=unclassified Candidatus Accumulibacter TaxID=2619054 RepID=UPI001A58242A|nr:MULTISPECIES: HDOD domain-containing protein [unclassified Candidatus Accumulibacter]MBL8367870.1 HDOD domain-containing protein [Accumulibacter sp.]HRI90204.1 HDOD domain-containing protein [Accumulibacter sp.]